MSTIHILKLFSCNFGYGYGIGLEHFIDTEGCGFGADKHLCCVVAPKPAIGAFGLDGCYCSQLLSWASDKGFGVGDAPVAVLNWGKNYGKE